MPALDFFNTEAFFINLDSRPDRLAHMTRELKRVGIKAQRIPGLLPELYTGDPSKVAVMKARTPGAIGAHFAQRSLIARAAHHKRNVMVLEDDVVWCSDLPMRMARIERFLNATPWAILWLGGTVHINPAVWHKSDIGRDAECTEDDRIVRTYGAFCTYAYVVNGDYASRVVELLDANVHRSIGIDWLMIDSVQPKLPTYMYLPGAAKQMDGRSSIGRGDTIFSAFSKLGAFWFQDRADGFEPAAFDFGEAKAACVP